MPQKTIKKKLGISNLSFFSWPSFHIIIAFFCAFNWICLSPQVSKIWSFPGQHARTNWSCSKESKTISNNASESKTLEHLLKDEKRQQWLVETILRAGAGLQLNDRD